MEDKAKEIANAIHSSEVEVYEVRDYKGEYKSMVNVKDLAKIIETYKKLYPEVQNGQSPK